MKKVFIIFTVAIALFLSGFLTGYLLKRTKKISPSEIKTIQISGQEIKHSDYEQSKENLTFTTTSKGEGKIKTVIPKSIIPEANNWLNKRDCFQLTYHSSQQISAAYLRRFNCFAFGAGFNLPIDFNSGQKVSIFLVGQYWF